MVFYFSGTGNSRLAAAQIAQTIGEELVSINRCLREGGLRSYRSEGPLVFVAPTYAWRMPRVVEQWIRDTKFQGNSHAYFVLTCGENCGNAAAHAERLCGVKNFRFRGLAPVVMPENYLALFPTPEEPECRALVERARPRIAALAEKIKAGAPFPERAVSLRDRLESGPINPLFYTFCVRDRDFTVSDRCVSCGKCAVRCPLNNISLAAGRPVWRGRCTHCMACIGGCPTEAIEYGRGSQGRHRHYIAEKPTT